MTISKVVLFYAFTPLADPHAIRLWQRTLCESLGLRGRILISRDGINGTVGGEMGAVKKYLRTTKEHAAFAAMPIKWSAGTGHDFPRLIVKVRRELVSFGAPDSLIVDSSGVVGGGTRITPDALHELVASTDVTFFDGRNRIEAAIGKFAGAIVPDVGDTRDFVAELDSGRYDHLKNSAIVTYCTGGIRCEVLSALMIDRGFAEVYQLEGGIASYGQRYGDDGLWNGSLYVFDERISIDFSEHAVVIGRCFQCGSASNHVENCAEPRCRQQVVACSHHRVEAGCAEHSTSELGASERSGALALS
ncbi:MAG: rhodanese-related sulfurtransferase [Microbacteriaceae bacterium]|nr:rhodanese-related sulfurtransferase [Microbacteriaceae bacterium]